MAGVNGPSRSGDVSPPLGGPELGKVTAGPADHKTRVYVDSMPPEIFEQLHGGASTKPGPPPRDFMDFIVGSAAGGSQPTQIERDAFAAFLDEATTTPLPSLPPSSGPARVSVPDLQGVTEGIKGGKEGKTVVKEFRFTPAEGGLRYTESIFKGVMVKGSELNAAQQKDVEAMLGRPLRDSDLQQEFKVKGDKTREEKDITVSITSEVVTGEVGGSKVAVGMSESVGVDKSGNEDQTFSVTIKGVGTLSGVADGHGGPKMAQYIKANIQKVFESELRKVSRHTFPVSP